MIVIKKFRYHLSQFFTTVINAYRVRAKISEKRKKKLLKYENFYNTIEYLLHPYFTQLTILLRNLQKKKRIYVKIHKYVYNIYTGKKMHVVRFLENLKIYAKQDKSN